MSRAGDIFGSLPGRRVGCSTVLVSARRLALVEMGIVICLTTTKVELLRLDPRAPLVLDTRELGRRPGSERRVSLTAPAPADLGIEVLHVPEGSPVEFDIRLEAVVEGVLVTGTAEAVLVGECVRCLEEISREITADFQELFVYDESSAGEETEDGETSRLEGDLVDLAQTLRR